MIELSPNTLICSSCGSALVELPFFNGGDEAFVPSVPFCRNKKCKRHGLLTVVYKTREVKGEENRNEGVPEEDVPAS